MAASRHVHSMTAFARTEQAAPFGTLQVEIRSVNQRYLEPHFRLHESLRDLEPVLREALHRHTGKRWTVEEVAGGAGAPSLVEVLEAERTAAAAAMRSHPLVKAAFDAFPDAELIEEGGAPPERREIPWSRKA